MILPLPELYLNRYTLGPDQFDDLGIRQRKRPHEAPLKATGFPGWPRLRNIEKYKEGLAGGLGFLDRIFRMNTPGNPVPGTRSGLLNLKNLGHQFLCLVLIPGLIGQDRRKKQANAREENCDNSFQGSST